MVFDCNPSRFEKCNILIITLQFQAKFGACKSAKVCSPLVIGSVPLQGTYQPHMPDQLEDGGTSLVTSIPQGSRSPSPLAPAAEYFPRTTPSAPTAASLMDQNGIRDDPPPYSAIVMPSDYKNVRKYGTVQDF